MLVLIPAISSAAFLWLVFLITIPGVTDEPRFLMVVSGAGMLQNVFAAGTLTGRRLGAFGVYLELKDYCSGCVGRSKEVSGDWRESFGCFLFGEGGAEMIGTRRSSWWWGR